MWITTNNTGSTFQVKTRIQQQLDEEKTKITERLEPFIGGTEPRVEGRPELHGAGITYELAEKTRAITCGGIGVIHRLVQKVGLQKAIDKGLGILKRARPYQDSDHILNIAFNLLCGGRVLDDIEHRRNDAAFLDGLGARAIPDPTTAGDFCRRFDVAAIWRLMNIINSIRVKVWRLAGIGHGTARIDADGSIVETTGECKQGMDMSYKGIWGYHPLLISLANTKEPLFIVNRSGNRPSHEGAPATIDKAIDLCLEGGFKDVLVRGDTDFSMTEHLDRWDDLGYVRFILGYDANPAFVDRAENLDSGEYVELCRKADEAFENKKRRKKQPRVKEEIVRARGYLNKRLIREDVADFEHRPKAAKKPYRIVVLRKQIVEERGQLTMGCHYRYFFYITNDRNLSCAKVVAEANERCDQENIIEQLKNGAPALTAPVNTLEANWAYMVMASLAWTLKAWSALLLPVDPQDSATQDSATQDSDRRTMLRMDFRTFLNNFILIPAQIVRTGRRTIFRLLAWRPRLDLLFRLLDAL